MNKFINRTLFQITLLMGLTSGAWAAPLNISPAPLFVGISPPPLIMLLMDKSHELYLPAYDDKTDLNGDGVIDNYFLPGFLYAGYFDSKKCYNYDYSGQYFYPVGPTGALYTCSNQWSGNFLNYLTMTRVDILRQALYGGYRSTDSADTTILERAFLTKDAHSFGKEINKKIPGYENLQQYTPLPQLQAAFKDYHLFINTSEFNSTTGQELPVLKVMMNTKNRIWDWSGIPSPSASNKLEDGQSGPNITDEVVSFVVRVKVCVSGSQLEGNCKTYPNGSIKPTGVLQYYGESEKAYFGLMTGSYDSNMQGGILRKNISSFNNEVNANTGQFMNNNGIVSTLNSLKIKGYNPLLFQHDCNISNMTNLPMSNGECQMWGNPLAHMLYESIRYFAGKDFPTSSFSNGNAKDIAAGLSAPNWVDPYDTYPRCSKLLSMVVSASDPSYDSTLVPGSAFLGIASDISPAMDVSALAQTIFSNSGFNTQTTAWVGQMRGVGTWIPSLQPVTSFGQIQGLGPESAHQKGSFYTASVAYYGWLNTINDNQKMKTIVLAFSPKQARIKFNIGGKIITFVPFGKSVQGMGLITPIEGQFQPTNEIVSFFIESISPLGATATVHFSNLEQGGTYSMATRVRYTLEVINGTSLKVTVESLNSYTPPQLGTFLTQHLGYVISGTNADGIYLVVKDKNTTADPDYYLDRPQNGDWQDNKPLPLSDTRSFTPGPQTITEFKSPLWYAAKWGGFIDSNNNNIPDVATEFSSDGVNPDNYISGTNPSSLIPQLNQQLVQITDRMGTFSMPFLTTNTLQSQTILFQTLFHVNNWRGDLLAYNMNMSTGEVNLNGPGRFGSIWSAQTLLDQTTPQNRVILTYNPTLRTGTAFLWTPLTNQVGLDIAQQTALNKNPVTGNADDLGQDRVQFLRGMRTKETPDGVFRKRLSVLGDMINSRAIYVGGPHQSYPDFWGGNAPENNSPYSAFRLGSAASRTPIVYVGANDGMLHGFNANTGQELLAYVPAAVYKHLPQLTHPNYTHQYYVDGTPVITDAFLNQSWRTILVGHLNSGGQGVFALDVTNPALFTQNNAANLVKWEFSDKDDPDMGMSFSQPVIVRLENGQWAAIFGNGYNNTEEDGIVSTTGNAVLYIVNLDTGALIKKLDTQVGMAQDPTGTNRPNGMSSPTAVSLTGRQIADVVYAGDLYGNLWKIDISSSDPANWDFSFKSGLQPAPFFIAVDSLGKRQPITVKPTVAGYAYATNGFKIFIGTGKYLEASDVTDQSIQSIYGLYDKGPSIPDRSVLLNQSITSQSDMYRSVSSNILTSDKQGWYLDLISGTSASERLFSQIRFINKKITFTTLIPSEDPCQYGGISWLMEINAEDGSNLNYNPFIESTATSTENTVIPSGMRSSKGITASPVYLQSGGIQYYFTAGTSGSLSSAAGNAGPQNSGRQSWRQLQ